MLWYPGRYRSLRRNIRGSIGFSCRPSHSGVFRGCYLSSDNTHSSREIPACFKIRIKRSTPISFVCGFGTVRTRSSLIMNGCLPPEYGPSNPKFLSPRTRPFHDTGRIL